MGPLEYGRKQVRDTRRGLRNSQDRGRRQQHLGLRVRLRRSASMGARRRILHHRRRGRVSAWGSEEHMLWTPGQDCPATSVKIRFDAMENYVKYIYNKDYY